MIILSINPTRSLPNPPDRIISGWTGFYKNKYSRPKNGRIKKKRLEQTRNGI